MVPRPSLFFAVFSRPFAVFSRTVKLCFVYFLMLLTLLRRVYRYATKIFLTLFILFYRSPITQNPAFTYIIILVGLSRIGKRTFIWRQYCEDYIFCNQGRSYRGCGRCTAHGSHAKRAPHCHHYIVNGALGLDNTL